MIRRRRSGQKGRERALSLSFSLQGSLTQETTSPPRTTVRPYHLFFSGTDNFFFRDSETQSQEAQERSDGAVRERDEALIKVFPTHIDVCLTRLLVYPTPIQVLATRPRLCLTRFRACPTLSHLCPVGKAAKKHLAKIFDQSQGV